MVVKALKFGQKYKKGGNYTRIVSKKAKKKVCKRYRSANGTEWSTKKNTEYTE